MDSQDQDDQFDFLIDWQLPKVEVVLIYQSRGALTFYAALAYATRHPEHPAALILTNTEAVVDPEAKKTAYEAIAKRKDKRDFSVLKNMSDEEIIAYTIAAATASLRYDYDKSLENFNLFSEKGFSLISKSQFGFISPMRVNMKMKEMLGNGYGAFDYRSALSKIQCTVLWLAGEWDPLHPLSCATHDAALLKNVKFVVLNAGAPTYQDDLVGFEHHVRELFSNLHILSFNKANTKRGS